MTAALRITSPYPSDGSVTSAPCSICNTPVVRQQSIADNSHLVAEAPLNMPLSSLVVPGWNSQGRLAIDTPAESCGVFL